MRSYIMATEKLTLEEDQIDDAPVAAHRDIALLEDLESIIFKLRAFMESSDGDYALGVECGMQRAADMIESALKRHTESVCGH